jgi:signal transduction histidine kinase
MMNYAQLIQDEVPSDGQIAEFAGRIFAEGERIAGIVRGLLAFARQDKEAHSPSAVGDIVRAGVSLLGNTFVKDHVRLEIEIPDDLPKVRCRSQQIQQVVLNLLTNARDALNERHPGSHEDKVLRVAAVPWEIGGFPAVRLTVEDHGTGIPEAVRERVFEPFFTTKQRGVGTGLGLSISHGIVEEHHGRLTCESEPGKGASFHVDLPVDNGWRLGSDPGDAPPDAGQGG